MRIEGIRCDRCGVVVETSEHLMPHRWIMIKPSSLGEKTAASPLQLLHFCPKCYDVNAEFVAASGGP